MSTIIITMAGLGSRFRSQGYNCAKFMIRVNGRSLFAWSLDSLAEFRDSKHVFVCLNEDDAESFIDSECDLLGINQRQVIQLSTLTSGQAETAYIGCQYADPAKAVCIFNIDTHVKGGFRPVPSGYDGFIPCFLAEGDHWSFVKVDELTNDAVEVREKTRISPYATIGMYWFSSGFLFRDLYERFYANGNHSNYEKGEAYIAPMYNELIAEHYRVGISVYDKQSVVPLGTPEEVKAFAK